MDVESTLGIKLETVGEQGYGKRSFLTALEDWVWGGLRTKREAELFLFEDQVDFPQVCESAGMNVDLLRSRLKKLRNQQSRN